MFIIRMPAGRIPLQFFSQTAGCRVRGRGLMHYPSTFFLDNILLLMLLLRAMSKKANIYSFKSNMTQEQLCRLLNTNFDILARTTQVQMKEIHQTVTQTHNELSGRDKPDCHGIDSISNLKDTLDNILNDINDINTAINDINDQINDINDTLDDHEDRIKALEAK